MFSLKEKIEIQNYFAQKKELHSILLKFIENSNNDDEDFQNLINFIKPQNIQDNKEEFNHFLHLIIKVCKNHHKKSDFYSKIEQILLHFGEEIKQTFLNLEIFNIFKNNKQILLSLIKQKILTLDETIVTQIMNKIDKNNTKYCHFFITEIKEFIEKDQIQEIENDLIEIDSNIFNDFDEKRKKGENDSIVCSLIRNDSIDEFTSLVNEKNLSLLDKIPTSIFETNSFLLDKEPTLIEYASFFGSIKIIQFLKSKEVELTPSLWLYSVHSNSLELIHYLDENGLQPPENSFENCFIESIKCHHNIIANFIQSKLNEQDSENLNDLSIFNEKVVECSFRSFNYPHFPNDFDSNFGFFYLCRYNYSKIVDLFLKTKKNEIEAKIRIFLINFFCQVSIIKSLNVVSKS